MLQNLKKFSNSYTLWDPVACRYYEDFLIDKEHGESNLTQLYIKVFVLLLTLVSKKQLFAF